MEKITISSVSIDDTEIQYVNDALKSEMLSAGKYLDTFEKEFSKYYGKQYGVMVNSGQSAIEVAMEYCIEKLEGHVSVAVPALTYMATIWGALRTGAQLYFYDIKLSDYGIRPGEGWASGEIGRNFHDCDIAVAVDLFGKKCNFIKENPNQLIIEDACESTGNKSCSYGDFICFSFYSSHIMSTGGAGIVLLNDPKAEEFIRGYIAHGRTHSGDFTKHTDHFMDRFVFSSYGQSLRSDNIHAAIALAQYQKLETLIEIRRAVAARITNNLSILKDISILPNFDNNVFMFYPIVFDKPYYHALSLMEYLYKHNIDSRRFMPVTEQPAFKKEFGLSSNLFPNATMCANKGILLGCHPKLSYNQIDYMCETVINFFKERKDI